MVCLYVLIISINYRILALHKSNWLVSDRRWMAIRGIIILIFGVRRVCRFIFRCLINRLWVIRLWFVGSRLGICCGFSVWLWFVGSRLGICCGLSVRLWFVSRLGIRWIGRRFGVFVRFGFTLVLDVSDVTVFVSLVGYDLFLWEINVGNVRFYIYT